MNELTNLPKRLRQKRRAADLTQKKVAHVLGYSTSQFISNWERGVAHPPIRTLKRLAELYNIPSEELFNLLLQNEVRQLTNSLKEKLGHV